MTKQSSPHRVIHQKRLHGLHALHASGRDKYGKFLPRHGHCVPESLNEENGNADTESVAVPRNFPDTGTPDLLSQTHGQEKGYEHGERIAASDRIVPETDALQWPNGEPDDWIDVENAH